VAIKEAVSLSTRLKTDEAEDALYEVLLCWLKPLRSCLYQVLRQKHVDSRSELEHKTGFDQQPAERNPELTDEQG